MLFDSYANNTPEIMQHQITAVKQDDKAKTPVADRGGARSVIP